MSRKGHASRSRLLLTAIVALLATAAVSPLGAAPAHTAQRWQPTGGPPGGLGYDIRHNFPGPQDPTVWYVTDAFSGVHKSTDNGLTWSPSNFGIETRIGPTNDIIAAFSLTVDRNHPQTIWLGLQYPGTIYKSEDGGVSWILKSRGLDANGLNLLEVSFRGFTVHPGNSDHVYAMAEIGSPGWTDDGEKRIGLEMDMTKGILFHTTNGGDLWEEVDVGTDEVGTDNDLNLFRYCWIDPDRPENMFISTGIFDREAANTDVVSEEPGGVGILRSDDGSASWDTLDGSNGLLDLYIGSLYMSPDDPSVMLAAAGQDSWSRRTTGAYTGGIFRTTNAGESWTRVIDMEKPGEIFGVVEICDSDPSVAYAISEFAVYRSGDAGFSWQRFDNGNDAWGAPGMAAGTPIDAQCDPYDPMRLFVNNYRGGNFLSRNGGRTWTSASRGYTGALVSRIAIAPDSRSRLYAGSRTGIFRTDNGGDLWVGIGYPPPQKQVKVGSIQAIAVDPNNGDHVLTSPGDLDGILYSWNGGRSWRQASWPEDGGNPITIAFAPSDPGIVYAGVAPGNCRDEPESWTYEECNKEGTGVFLSVDGGISFVQTGLETLNDRAVLELAAHTTESAFLLAATYPDGIWRSTDGGATWGEAEGISPFDLEGIRVVELTYDPTEPSVVFAGTMEGGLLKSSDGGQTFSLIGGGTEPNGIIDSIVVDPTNGQTVYAADRFSGVYYSVTGGADWQALNGDLDNEGVRALALSDDGTVLYAGIDGAGVYRLGPAPPDPLPHDLCAGAVEMPAGTRAESFLATGIDGESSCGTLSGVDQWYRYTAPANGPIHINSCGTHDVIGPDQGIDTGISVHSGCPGTPANELGGGCNNDWHLGNDPTACELFDQDTFADAATELTVSAGQEVWIRVEHRAGPPTGEFWLSVDEAFPAAGAVPDGFTGEPLRLEKSGPGTLSLTWGASCLSSDSDFAVYRGEIGDFESHQQAACSTAGATMWQTDLAPENLYYLVVPNNGANEGSYGLAGRVSDLAERPASATACYPQVVGSCE